MSSADSVSLLGRLATHLAEDGLDVLVVTNSTNIRYLTGFSGSAGTLIVRTPNATDSDRPLATLITDGRYEIQAPEECTSSGAPVTVRITGSAGWLDIIEEIGSASRVGLESNHVTWADRDRFADSLDGVLISTSGMVEALREVKSAEEIRRVDAAAAIADQALALVRPLLADGLTERQIAARLDSSMRDLGADRPGFDTIVASGPNSARPHHQPGDRALAVGDLVVVDFGAELDGYRSDMTRSFSIGSPNDRAAEMLDAVEQAQAAGVATAAPGVEVSELDKACRAVLGQRNLAEYFTHGTGHGVGLDIHEAPSVSARGTATLTPGHVITVEPGVYVEGFGGVRWEDTIVVTESGAEALTRSPKDPVIEIL